MLSNTTYSCPNPRPCRVTRTKAIVDVANMVTRVKALKGFPEQPLALYISPNAGDYFTNLATDNAIGAAKLNISQTLNDHSKE
jgi:hypothetical protein